MEKQPFDHKNNAKQQKRRGTISLEQSKGPPQHLYHGGLSILTIGDGDLSFSMSIAKWLQYKYPQQSNLGSKKAANKKDKPEIEDKIEEKQQLIEKIEQNESKIVEKTKVENYPQLNSELNKSSILTITSYDSKEDLIQFYSKGTIKHTLSTLQQMKNVEILYQIDVNILEKYQLQLLQNCHQKQIKFRGGYDRIVWNFPHAGFPEEEKGQHKGPGFQWEQAVNQKHIKLIANFFQKSHMYLNKQRIAQARVIMTHKTIKPFDMWNIPKIGEQNGYQLIEQIEFDIDQYPGYQNRKGTGKRAGKRFPCDDAKTYVFRSRQQNKQHP